MKTILCWPHLFIILSNFFVILCRAYRPLVQCRRDRDTGDMYEVFDGMTLKDGYLYKKVPLDSLSFWDVRPSEAELLKFSPGNKEESNDVEWLTGLFGERKKKKPTVSNNNTGGKGEGSSSSTIENGFEVPDLVLHGYVFLAVRLKVMKRAGWDYWVTRQNMFQLQWVIV